MKTVAIIPAAGIGKRLPGEVAKQFLKLQGKPILAHTLQKFQHSPHVDEVFLVTSKKLLSFVKTKIVDRYDFSKVSDILIGGKERQDSVYEGIKALDSSTGIVLVHDGVRPFVSISKIEALIQRCRKDEAVILAVRPKDTVKTDTDGTVGRTLDRNQLWLAQTPQVFKYSVIKTAFEKAYVEGFYGTDEAALVERMGGVVKVLEGDYENIKITTPEDLKAAEIIAGKTFN